MQKKLFFWFVFGVPGRAAALDQRQGAGDEQNPGTLMAGVRTFMAPQQWEQGMESDFKPLLGNQGHLRCIFWCIPCL